MLYSIRGKFADNHSFSAQIDGAGPQDALTSFTALDDVKGYAGGAITQVSVIRMEGKKRVRISEKPAKARAKRKDKSATPATPAAPSTPAATNTGKGQTARR